MHSPPVPYRHLDCRGRGAKVATMDSGQTIKSDRQASACQPSCQRWYGCEARTQQRIFACMSAGEPARMCEGANEHWRFAAVKLACERHDDWMPDERGRAGRMPIHLKHRNLPSVALGKHQSADFQANVRASIK